MSLLRDIVLICKPGQHLVEDDYVTDLRRSIDDIHQDVRSHIQIANDCMKERNNIRAEESLYVEGDLVWLYNPQRIT